VWHLIGHFIEDLTHFDGKFFSSLKYLIIKPGYLSEQYVKGKRASYLNPIRMYLFISAMVFLIITEFFITPAHVTPRLAHFRDSVMYGKHVGPEEINFENFDDQGQSFYAYSFYPPYVHSGVKAYDSLMLAKKTTHQPWLDRFVGRTFAQAAYTYGQDPNGFISHFTERIIHSFSKIFFISLPIFAFILWLLYIRRKNNFYYVTHAIFALHIYCITFLLILLISAMISSEFMPPWTVYATMSLVFVYLYIAMLRFYKQGWFKTFIKFFIASTFMVVLLSALTFIFFINSFISTAAA